MSVRFRLVSMLEKSVRKRFPTECQKNKTRLGPPWKREPYTASARPAHHVRDGRFLVVGGDDDGQLRLAHGRSPMAMSDWPTRHGTKRSSRKRGTSTSYRAREAAGMSDRRNTRPVNHQPMMPARL